MKSAESEAFLMSLAVKENVAASLNYAHQRKEPNVVKTVEGSLENLLTIKAIIMLLAHKCGGINGARL